jgi:phosphoserine phosphatase RsbU/P
MRVLVAEDDLTSRRILRSLLVRWGYDVTFACDGAEAWNCLRESHSPKLVVLDWVMPAMDGIDVCRSVRQVPSPEPPYIIMLTARECKRDVIEGLDAGANDYIAKPYDPEELRARLQVGKRVVELQESLAKRVVELQDALAHIKCLQGILPICMHCHRIRTDEESWQRIESYIADHSEAQFTHGICPECLSLHYPGVRSPQ